MSEEQNENQFLPEEIKNYERQVALAIRVAKEAVKRLNIPESSPNDYQGTNLRWNVFYQDVGNNVVLSIELNALTSRGIIHCSLGQTVLEMLGDLETLLSDAEAMRIFEVIEAEKDEVIFERLVGLTSTYISYLPLVLYHSLHQAVSESKINFPRSKLTGY